jgi:hypothetical protein
MNMIKLILTFFVICSLLPVAPAQRRGNSRGQGNVRISKKHPTIYISFVRFGKSKPEREGYSGKRVWLRLHNNTRWSINLQAKDSADDSYGDLSILYEIEAVPAPELPIIGSSQLASVYETETSSKPINRYEKCDVPIGEGCGHIACGVVSLASGKSLLFSIPREHLCENLRINVGFSYNWEDDLNFHGNREPQHGVIFFGERLPKDAR